MAKQVFRDTLQDAELFVSSVTVFELYLRKEKLEMVSNLLANLDVLPFDEKSALIASGISKDLRMRGALVEYISNYLIFN